MGEVLLETGSRPRMASVRLTVHFSEKAYNKVARPEQQGSDLDENYQESKDHEKRKNRCEPV